MKLIVDTNVLVRMFTLDDPDQNAAAEKALARAELLVIPTSVLCELVWVLRRSYRISTADILGPLRDLVETANVRTVRPAVEAGLAMMAAGGDFADGVIAFEGAGLGGEIFASFDKEAVRILNAKGVNATLLY